MKNKVKKEKFNLKTKKNRLIFSFSIIGLAVVVTLSILLPILLIAKDNLFVIPELSLPEEDHYALSKYTYDQLDDVKVTVRADTRTLTKRDLPRKEVSMLSDNFSLVYDKTANKLFPYYEDYTTSSEYLADPSSKKVAKISFTENNYPKPYYSQSMSASKVHAAATAIGKSDEDYFTYYKYMLMSQGQHLAHEAAWRSALTASDEGGINEEFASWLKKHPAADGQYGAVVGTDNAVEKEILLDPIYRTWHTTGLYLPAGEPVTIKIEGLKPGESIGITLGANNSLAWRGGSPSASVISEVTGGKAWNQVNYQNSTSDYFFKQADLATAGGKFFDLNNASSSPFLQSQWKRQNSRAPWITCDFRFTENKTYTFGFAFGGLIQITMNNCYSQVKATINGAVETPHYILGSTTTDYFNDYLKEAPGVIAAIDTENGLLVGPTGELGRNINGFPNMRTVKKEEIDKLAMLWHSFISVNESFTGGTYNRFNKIMFDWHVPAGAAVALGNYSFAMPNSMFRDALNYQGLLKSGTWGTLHEIGHNHGSAYGVIWGFGAGREGEVRNNALTLLSYIMFCDVGTTIRMGRDAEHGVYANPYRTLAQTLTYKDRKGDYDDGSYDYFRCLGMYSNIMHSFGAEKYYELLYSYKLNPSFIEIDTKTLTTTERNRVKRADFAYRCSTVYGMNFLNYFNNFYAANIINKMFTQEQLNFMNSLPNYNPISNFYAGGIDGVKTSGDYEVRFGDDITFDLMSTTISTLDENDKKGFEIISVNKPKYGSIRKTQDEKYAYSFNKNYTGPSDEFSFDVKLNDGVVHRLTIYLRIIGYNTARISRYVGVTDPGKGGAVMFDSFNQQISEIKPEHLTSSVGATLTPFTSSQLEVRTSDFWWQSPVTGQVALSIGGNVLRLYVGKDFQNLEATGLVFSGQISGTDTRFKHVLNVEKGKHYAIRLMTTNKGSMNKKVGGTVYVLQKDSQVVGVPNMSDEIFADLISQGAGYQAIPTSQVFHPSYPLGKEFTTYEFQPYFMVSKKNNIKLSNSGTDKTMWEVLKAPEFIHGGVAHEDPINNPGKIYEKHVQYVPQVDENGNELKDENGNVIRKEYNVYYNMWNYLIDGETGTHLHTSYTGNYTPLSENNPHEFIIDTQKVQSMNFFKVTTRNNANSYIENFEFYLADEMKDDGSFNWNLIKTGDRSLYNKNSITLKFETHQARYLRLVVKETSGGKFSVLSEIDAGIESPTQKLISLSSSKLFTTSGFKSTTTIDSEPNGYLMSESANSAAVIKFIGDSVSLYARTDQDCGKIKVIIDGEAQEIDLHSDSRESRKLVFLRNDLENKEHTMEIITMGSGKVVLNALGLGYSASLLNASNIYLERALTISLIVFIALFICLATLTLCLLFIPKFRNKMGNNKAINWLDKKLEENKTKRKQKRANKKAQNLNKQAQEKQNTLKDSPQNKKSTKIEQDVGKSKKSPAKSTLDKGSTKRVKK